MKELNIQIRNKEIVLDGSVFDSIRKLLAGD